MSQPRDRFRPAGLASCLMLLQVSLGVGRTGSRVSAPALAPVLDVDVPESGKVFDVCRDKDQVIYERNSSNLTVNVRSGSPQAVEPCALVTMPVRRGFVIREHRERCQNHVVEVSLKRCPPVPAWPMHSGPPGEHAEELISRL